MSYQSQKLVELCMKKNAVQFQEGIKSLLNTKVYEKIQTIKPAVLNKKKIA